MANTREHLERWLRAGLLDEATAHRIEAWERRPAPAGAGGRPTLVEAGVYLGVAVIAVGVFVLVERNWQHFGAAARIGLPGALTLAAIAAGSLAPAAGTPALLRAGQVLWAAAVAFAATTAAVVTAEGDVRSADQMLVTSLAGLGFAVILWLRRRSYIQLLAIAVPTFFASLGVAAEVERADVRFGWLAFGAVLGVVGIAGVVLAEAGLLEPRRLGQQLGAAAIAYASFAAGMPVQESGGDAVGLGIWTELLFIPAGVGLVLAGIRRGTFDYLVPGFAAIFLGLTTFILRNASSESVAAVQLIGVGTLLIAAILATARLRSGGPRHRGAI